MIEAFVVFDTWMGEYVADVDPYDGDVEHTSRATSARIFYGATWRGYWGGERYRLEPVPGGVRVDEPIDLSEAVAEAFRARTLEIEAWLVANGADPARHEVAHAREADTPGEINPELVFLVPLGEGPAVGEHFDVEAAKKKYPWLRLTTRVITEA